MNTTPQPFVKLAESDIGMSFGYKQLFSGKEDKHGRFQWRTSPPKDLGTSPEDAENERWALVVRRTKVYNDPKKVLSIHSVVVQSPLLKDLLKEVLEGYPGVTIDHKRLEFSGSFEPLIHRWAELNAAIDALKQQQASAEPGGDVENRINHATLLRELLANEFEDTIKTTTDLKSRSVTTYEHLWTLFQPGRFVYSKQQGQDSILRLHSSYYGKDRHGNPVYWLVCQYVDYDGSRWGTHKFNISIATFEGSRPITNLPAFPTEFHQEIKALKSRLIERGGKVEELAGSKYRAYNGVGWRMDSVDRKEKFTVRGRVVIDTCGWNFFNPSMSIFVTPFHYKDNSPAAGLGGNDEYNEGYVDDDSGMPRDGFFADEENSDAEIVALTEEQKMICTPLVRGYALKEKLWLNFSVDKVHEIEFNDRAYQSLVLPEKQKELILGLTATQQSCRSQVDDVTGGKGKGLVILLCGPPGVGKTLTAESVAEEMKVPLFMLSAGDLGSDPRIVEAKLQDNMGMVTRWNGILLLDEADVFLGGGSLLEPVRNKVVSVFLRVLENYEGIMFLTTNCLQTFDQAFQSRINISLDYKELDIKSRKIVWENLLKQRDVAQAAAHENGLFKPSDEAKMEMQEEQTHPHQITAKQIEKLARLRMNGRQIKNLLKTAQLLAVQKGEGLKYAHFETVMDLTQHLHHQNSESERAMWSFYS